MTSIRVLHARKYFETRTKIGLKTDSLFLDLEDNRSIRVKGRGLFV